MLELQYKSEAFPFFLLHWWVSRSDTYMSSANSWFKQILKIDIEETKHLVPKNYFLYSG